MNRDVLKIMESDCVNSSILLRTSLKAFIQVFHYYMTREDFIFKPFHLVLINKLEDIVFGKNVKQNLAISISPRTGKSLISKYFISWCFAINRNSNFIYTSYSDKLIQKFSGEIRDLINSELFNKLFGLTLAQDTKAKALWRIIDGGGLMASPLFGSLTGFGGGCVGDSFGGAVIIDDALSATDYKSEVARSNCWDVYTNTLKSRRENLSKTPIIVIMQRLHKEDLIGLLKEKEAEDWDFVSLPALQEDGTSIFPEKLPAEYLEKIKLENPYLFNAQYQQEPITLGGGVIKREWWRYYQSINVSYRKIFITADTAMKTKEWNDYTAIGAWGLTTDNRLYLLDMIHAKLEAPELEQTMLAFWDKWKKGISNRPATALYIEDKASGTGLIQSLRRKGGIPILPYMPDKDKLERVNDIIPWLASGNVYLPFSENDVISKEVLAETDAFSADLSQKHDDIVDMITMAIKSAYMQRGLF